MLFPQFRRLASASQRISRMEQAPAPLALLRGAAAVLPRPLLSRIAAAVLRGLERTHPKLLANLARLEPAVVHVAPSDLPYRFALTVGRSPVTLSIVDRGPLVADAEVSASVATLVDLLEGRIDGDTLFFRRDLVISGNTEVVVGLRNVLDREDLSVAAELGALCGPFRPQARAVARALDRALDQLGARVAAMHRTLHPPGAGARDFGAELERCRGEIGALTARLAALEARQKRRDEKNA
jgi:predicted lipid carrier protein YhbT